MLSVIFTTYNHPDWLEKVLWGYQCQTFKDFEILIADDGSGEDTRLRIEKMKQQVFYPIRHIWHEDRGFRKCAILNKAISAAAADYLVFSDGDCIPRKDFLQTHFEKRKTNCFLSGGAVRLPMDLSRAIGREDILTQKIFKKQWLTKHGLPQKVFKNLKLTQNKNLGTFLNKVTPTGATWNGGNASAWKSDILAVNGFDERMRYGAEDREFGARLENMGVKGIQIRYSAICVHLDHSRGYRNENDLKHNDRIWQHTLKNKTTRTAFGLMK